jgi:hypothetical protein
MTAARDMGRLHRSLAGVESGYVRDLGRRGPDRSRTRPPTAGDQARRAADRLDGAYRRVRGDRSTDSRRLARR